ncbi:uncharacterized protein LOC107997713 [Apis cerana]|uniref:DUF7775 domain-containing protein n=1 Tax=Apis cerana TaxID=7461 RepID=V9IK20_APICE|nr:uncharacterized protein LOC107997713 [Apis cerana]
MGMNKATIFKVVELIIVCVLIGLHYHSFSDSSLTSAFVTMGTFGGYLIILVGICLGIILGATIDHRLDLFFSIVGCILFIIAGALILDHFINAVYRGNFRNTGIAKGCISIIQGVLFLIDAVFAFRGN